MTRQVLHAFISRAYTEPSVFIIIFIIIVVVRKPRKKSRLSVAIKIEKKTIKAPSTSPAVLVVNLNKQLTRNVQPMSKRL